MLKSTAKELVRLLEAHYPGADLLAEIIVEAMTHTFEEEEAQWLLSFYASPDGQRLLALMPKTVKGIERMGDDMDLLNDSDE